MAKKSPGEKKSSKQSPTGHGGELQQQADGQHPGLTTQQGIPVPDNQNSLTAWEKGPTLLEDFILRKEQMNKAVTETEKEKYLAQFELD